MCKLSNHRIDVRGRVDGTGDCAYAEGSGRALDQTGVIGSASWRGWRVKNEFHAFKARRYVFKQFDPFARHRGLHIRKSGGIPTRPCKARGKALADRVGNRDEYDWDRFRF